jgi:hypothetical protein
MKQGVRGGDAASLFKRAADLGGSIGIGAGVDSFPFQSTYLLNTALRLSDCWQTFFVIRRCRLVN